MRHLSAYYLPKRTGRNKTKYLLDKYRMVFYITFEKSLKYMNVKCNNGSCNSSTYYTCNSGILIVIMVLVIVVFIVIIVHVIVVVVHVNRCSCENGTRL